MSDPTAAPPADEAPVKTQKPSDQLFPTYRDSELVFGLIGAVGVDLKPVCNILEDRLNRCGYNVNQIRITRDVLPTIIPSTARVSEDEFERIEQLMNAGNQARLDSGDYSILSFPPSDGRGDLVEDGALPLNPKEPVDGQEDEIRRSIQT